MDQPTYVKYKKKKVKKKDSKGDTLRFGKSYVLRETFDKYREVKGKGKPDLKTGHKERPYISGDNNSFKEAFSWARDRGYKTFVWHGKHYNTKLKKKG